MVDVIYIKAAGATVLCLATLFVNIPVVIVTTRSERLKEDLVTRVMTSLAVSDIINGGGISCLAAFIAWIQPSTVPDAFTQTHGMLFYLFAHNAFWHLAFASVIKCVVIVWPLTYSDIITDRRINLMLSAIWIINIAADFIFFAIGVRYGFDWIQILPNLANYFLVLPPIGIISFFAATICMIICYTKIFIVVRKTLASTAPDGMFAGSAATSAGIQTSQIKEKFLLNVRSAKTICIICATFLLSYLPYILRGMFAYNNVAFTFFSRWIFDVGSATNGLLYLVLHKKVREECKKMFSFGKVSDNLKRSSR